MSNSSLVSYTKLSPNSSARSGKIDKITIHHMAGNLTIEACGAIFQSSSRQASSNYGIGTDGRIGLYVDEHRRAWTSSNRENDNRAVTIEVANDGGAPNWHVSDKALESTIALCVDICKRNGIKALNFTGDKSGNLTMHKWFTSTQCPGPYLESKFPYIAAEVNKRLSAAAEPEKPQQEPTQQSGTYSVQVGVFSKKSNAERKRQTMVAAGFDAYITCPDSQSWRVQVGAFEDRSEAEQMLKQLRAAGFSSCITSISGKPSTTTTAVSYLVQVKISNLRIRKGPGTNYGSAGFINPGIYTIVQESSGTGSTKGWGKLKSGAGWISLDYCSKMQS